MKTTSLGLVLWVCLVFLATGCSPEDDPTEYNFQRLAGIDLSPSSMTGQVTGKANAVYTFNGEKIICTDEAADYQMTLSKYNQVPKDSLITGKLPENSQYFSLDIMGVMRILDNFKCLERDPSKDRIHAKIEGYFTASNYKFTALNCSKESKIANTEIYFSSENVVKGTLECVYLDEMKYTYEFADLKLK